MAEYNGNTIELRDSMDDGGWMWMVFPRTPSEEKNCVVYVPPLGVDQNFCTRKPTKSLMEMLRHAEDSHRDRQKYHNYWIE